MIQKYTHAFEKLIAKACGPSATIIHTPKCGGTFLHAAYNLQQSSRIRSIGHGCVRQLRPSERTGRLVGLIRDPIDWYTSYLAFCRRGLREAPQSDENFPNTHPICVFSDNGTSSLAQMIREMGDKGRIKKVCASGTVAKIYAGDIPDVYEFMLRTDSGFWTWTMMYHFGRRPISALRDRDDVLAEATWISKNVSFIHQERLCEDVQRILKLPSPATMARLNCSSRFESDLLGSDTVGIVARCDGHVAHVLGHSELGRTVA